MLIGGVVDLLGGSFLCDTDRALSRTDVDVLSSGLILTIIQDTHSFNY
jgi:hypothetical protein